MYGKQRQEPSIASSLELNEIQGLIRRELNLKRYSAKLGSESLKGNGVRTPNRTRGESGDDHSLRIISPMETMQNRNRISTAYVKLGMIISATRAVARGLWNRRHNLFSTTSWIIKGPKID